MFNGIDNNSRGNMPCDKVCIQTKKVFDACIKQATLENVVITSIPQIPRCRLNSWADAA